MLTSGLAWEAASGSAHSCHLRGQRPGVTCLSGPRRGGGRAPGRVAAFCVPANTGAPLFGSNTSPRCRVEGVCEPATRAVGKPKRKVGPRGPEGSSTDKHPGGVGLRWWLWNEPHVLEQRPLCEPQSRGPTFNGKPRACGTGPPGRGPGPVHAEDAESKPSRDVAP